MTRMSRRTLARLEAVYGAEEAGRILPELEALIEKHAPGLTPRAAGWSEKDVLLITYADSIVEEGVPPLQSLQAFLADNVGEAITLIHLLPFFPYSSDDGFAVTDFRQVRPDLGSWDDVARLAERYRLVFDGVINHVSASSGYMKGFCAGDPRYEDFFISLPPDTDTSSVLRTRNLPLLHEYDTSEGRKHLWTTFSKDQVDLNFANPGVLLEIVDVLLGYVSKGASAIRLDAVPYLWKELGTSCAHLPKTHDIIKLLRDVLDVAAPWVILLAECNVPHHENLTYHGDSGDEAQIIYNFTLPPLVLDSIHKGDATRLTEWARTIRFVGERATFLNMTATHDGIGVRPTEGLLSEDERAELQELARAHHGDVTGKRNADGSISPYELNINYFDAVNHPDSDEPLDLQVARFILSQAIPLSFIGIPAVYVHSLVGSRNDLEGAKRTGRARSINRQKLSHENLKKELADPESLRSRVFIEYRKLLEMRGKEPAFHPDAEQEVLDMGSSVFALRRTNRKSGESVTALHNVTGEEVEAGGETLAPYQVKWMR